MESDQTAQEPTPWEKFVELARKVVQTPKAEADRRERAWRASERNGSGERVMLRLTC